MNMGSVSRNTWQGRLCFKERQRDCQVQCAGVKISQAALILNISPHWLNEIYLKILTTCIALILNWLGNGLRTLNTSSQVRGYTNYRVSIHECHTPIWNVLKSDSPDFGWSVLLSFLGSNEVGAVEAELQSLFPRTRKELVFLHPHGTKFPRYSSICLMALQLPETSS